MDNRGADSGAVAFGRRAGTFLGAALGWGLIEAGWPRLRELELDLPGLPTELDGLRVMHLSDFHLGVPSPGASAVEKAVDWTAGVHPRMIVRRRPKLDPNTLSREADLRVLLCHYPRVFDALEPGRFDLVLAGHMHDGQIALPYPGGKLRFAHLSARYPRGVFRGPAGVMHVSPGLGTTFVPFRFRSE